ncbi:protein of unknown function [Burkholderia multivorans]
MGDRLHPQSNPLARGEIACDRLQRHGTLHIAWEVPVGHARDAAMGRCRIRRFERDSV